MWHHYSCNNLQTEILLIIVCSHLTFLDIYWLQLIRMDPFTYRDSCSPVGAAAREGDCELLYRLIQEGKPMDVRDNRGWSPLHEAAAHNSAKCMKVLLAFMEDREGTIYSLYSSTSTFLISALLLIQYMCTECNIPYHVIPLFYLLWILWCVCSLKFLLPQQLHNYIQIIKPLPSPSHPLPHFSSAFLMSP